MAEDLDALIREAEEVRRVRGGPGGGASSPLCPIPPPHPADLPDSLCPHFVRPSAPKSGCGRKSTMRSSSCCASWRRRMVDPLRPPATARVLLHPPCRGVVDMLTVTFPRHCSSTACKAQGDADEGGGRGGWERGGPLGSSTPGSARPDQRGSPELAPARQGEAPNTSQRSTSRV